jgi:hypothetical protein
MGLLIGLIFALISMVGAGVASAMQSNDMASRGFGAMFGIGAIILFPILYGVIGLCVGAIGAALYNVFAGLVGGVEFETRPSTTI